MRKVTLFIFLAAFIGLGIVSSTDHSAYSEDETPKESEVFPVTVDFESPRNFGFHVGDEIPLTITMKVEKGSILDLVNLPKKKEYHGPFEVRDVNVKKQRNGNQTEYAVSYDN